MRFEIWEKQQIAVLVPEPSALQYQALGDEGFVLVESFEHQDPGAADRYFRRWSTMESATLDRAERLHWIGVRGLGIKNT